MAEIVHQTEQAVLWHGDALDVLPQYPKESIGLLLTDPPYGVGFVSNYAAVSHGEILHDSGSADDLTLVRDVITHAVRMVKQKGHLYVFGPADPLDGQKVSDVVQIVWDKGVQGMGDLSLPWAAQWEPINFCVSMFRHGGKAGETLLSTKVRKGNVVRVNRKTGRHNRLHPTQKPVQLLRSLIESSTVHGECVLDPFAGSGATGVAALLEGRTTLLVEKDARYISAIIDRLKAAESLAQQMDEM